MTAHADPCDCGDPQHCGAFGCPCQTAVPDPKSPCAECGGSISIDRHWGALEDDAVHLHVPSRCRCGHPLEAGR